MGIYLNDLPPKAREQVARKMVQKASEPGKHRKIATSAAPPRNDMKDGKYHNVKTTRQVGDNVIHFDSQKEARRFDELVLLERTGKIRELKIQVDFTLQEAYTAPATGNRVRAIRYKADFTYLERVRDDFGGVQDCGLDTPPALRATSPIVGEGHLSDACGASSPQGEPLEWRLVVEDVKSEATRTRVYEIKKKLLMEKFGLAIREV